MQGLINWFVEVSVSRSLGGGGWENRQTEREGGKKKVESRGTQLWCLVYKRK